MNLKKLQPQLILLTYAAILVLFVLNFNGLSGKISWFASVTMPFILGFIIAFVLNRPYKFLIQKVLSPVLEKCRISRQKIPGMAQLFSILIVYFSLFFVVGSLIGVVVPQLIESIQTFSSDLSKYLYLVTPTLNSLMEQWNVNEEIARLINLYWQEILNTVVSMLNTMLPTLISLSMGAATSIYNIFSGLIISIYLLTSKEKLINQFKKVIYAFLPERWADYTLHVGRIANRAFGGFLTGQVIVSVIVGFLCFFGMVLFKMPYATLCAVVVGVTNVIPYFGPIIGAIPGMLILLLTAPIKALGFIVLIVCIQQFDGNFMSPKIVGNSVGISGVWVLFSIIVGGSLFGVPGMIMGLPTFGVLYTLLREAAHARLAKKGRTPEDPEHLAPASGTQGEEAV